MNDQMMGRESYMEDSSLMFYLAIALYVWFLFMYLAVAYVWFSLVCLAVAYVSGFNTSNKQ